MKEENTACQSTSNAVFLSQLENSSTAAVYECIDHFDVFKQKCVLQGVCVTSQLPKLEIYVIKLHNKFQFIKKNIVDSLNLSLMHRYKTWEGGTHLMCSRIQKARSNREEKVVAPSADSWSQSSSCQRLLWSTRLGSAHCALLSCSQFKALCRLSDPHCWPITHSSAQPHPTCTTLTPTLPLTSALDKWSLGILGWCQLLTSEWW